MILAVLGLGGVGLWFLIAGDGPARLVGLALIGLRRCSDSSSGSPSRSKGPPHPPPCP
jgi:hypothetical protein